MSDQDSNLDKTTPDVYPPSGRVCREVSVDFGATFHFYPHPMWLFDAETLAFLDVNRAAEMHYGFTRDEFLQMTVKDIRPPSEVGRYLEYLRAHADEPSPASSSWRHRKKDGTIVDSEVTFMSVSFAGRPARLVLVHDLTPQRQTEAMVRALLNQVVSAQEEERRRVSRELHDDAAQALAALLVRLGAVESAELIDVARAAAREIRTHVVAAFDAVQRIARGLRPPALDDVGLAEALERLASELAEAHGLKVDVVVSIGEVRLPFAVETTLYRIAQETLTNVWKHARARTVSIVVRRAGDRVRLVIEDDGRGFEAEPVGSTRHLGLLGMRERAALLGGDLLVESAPGSGTRIHASIPFGGYE